jgi:hypothetical protein
MEEVKPKLPGPLTQPFEALPQMGISAGPVATLPTTQPTTLPPQQPGMAGVPTAQPTQPGAPVAMPLSGNMAIGGTNQIAATFSPYTATDNLRNKQISPLTNPVVSGVTNAAGSAYGGALAGVRSTDPNSAEASQARAMALGDLQNLGGPDRGQIAEDTLRRLISSTEPEYQKRVQGVGRDAARFGRLGSGVTTTNLGDLASERDRYIAETSGALASEAADKSLADRLGVFDARLRGSGQFTNEDLARGSFGLNRAATESDIGSRYADLGDRLYDRDLTERQEYRGERDFQNQMQQQSQQDYINQRTLEEMLLNGEWGRDMGYTQMLLGGGYGG